MPNYDGLIGDGVSAAGDITLHRIFIHDGKRGRAYNLAQVFLELDIYEDLFSPYMSGTITISDTFNLITGIPIIGEEMLEVEFSTPSLNDYPIQKKFAITKVEERFVNGDKASTFVLHFISFEALIDLNTNISRAYSGTGSEIIKNIYETTLKIDEELEVDNSDNRIKFVSPFWSPFQCISYASSRCVYPNGDMVTPNFLFYETNKKFKLKSLSTLFKQTPFMTYFYDKNTLRNRLPDGTSTRNVEREYQTIMELDYTSSQDYIKQSMRGIFSYNVTGLNLLRKTISKNEYSYKNDFNKSNHLDGFPMHSPTIYTSKYGDSEQRRITYPQLFDGYGDIGDDILSKRVPLLGQLDIYKLDWVVHGRTDIEVGMVVDFKMNEYKSIDIEDLNKPKYDPYYSGRYLITAIQHRITLSKHQMTMQVVKESLLNEIDFNREF